VIEGRDRQLERAVAGVMKEFGKQGLLLARPAAPVKTK
jgi:hypothetical protein